MATAWRRPLALAAAAFLSPNVAQPQRPAPRVPDPPFTVAARPWDSETLGNHRAVVRVTAAAARQRAVRVTIPWRRPDRAPHAKGVIVVAPSGDRVRNVRAGTFTQAAGELTFDASEGAGRYLVYYLPYRSGGRSNYPNVTYLPPDTSADREWLRAVAADGRRGALGTGAVERFEAIDSLNAFAPMQVVATPAEVARLHASRGNAPFLVFPERRTHAIRMRDQLPQHWTVRGPARALSDTARRGEFLAFQLGVYARQALGNVRVRWSDLRAGAHTLPASRLTLFNTGGIGWDGRPFTARVDVAAGQVQALWGGLDVPRDAAPGRYVGAATVTADGVPAVTVPLAITVRSDVVLEGGADEPEKLTRLAWLNSTRGQQNEVIAPYTPITVEGHTLRILGRTITLDASGLPARIDSYFTPQMTRIGDVATPVLAAPMTLGPSDAEGRPMPGASRGVRFTRREAGTVAWEATTEGDGWTLHVRGTLEFDGYLAYEASLHARRAMSLGDVALTIPYTPQASTYVLGLGLTGQRRPSSYDWSWNVATRNQDGAWLGGVNAGLFFSLRGDNYVRPLNTNFYLQKPLLLPPSWGNGGRGRISWRETGREVRVEATSGARTLAPGDSLRFDAHLLITPFHALDTDAQWARRFYHRYAPLDSIAEAGATVVNIHHANAINPWINYPFIAHRELKDFVDDAHRRGMQVKIYNTVRELSNRAYELYALRSLGHEVFSPGKGGGYSWLQEHLQDDYIAAWFVPEIKDAAVVNSGMSRWHNYYVEGINWLVRRVGIDGLYLDDVAFDRTTMKRVRRMLQQEGRPGIIDLHSANQYNERDGFINSAMLYMEHFPYIDRLWFGEYFDYDKTSPDFWLTEVSGIPFGLMGEMLEGGGNPWRGMLYGMTNRMPWSNDADPRPLWRLWDDFGMRGAELLGYWAPDLPVTTGRDDVKATVYRQPGRALVAVASWATDTAAVALRVDWRALGIDSTRARLTAPAIARLQEPRSYAPGQPLTIAPGRGALLIIQ